MENKKNMENQKLYYKGLKYLATAILMAGVSVMSTGCGGKVVLTPGTVKEAVEDNSNKNEVDDVFLNVANEEETSVLEQISMLENYLEDIDKIEELKIKKFSGMKKVERAISHEEVSEAIMLYQQEGLTDVEKARIESLLLSALDQYKLWVGQNGQKACEKFLLAIVKIMTCSEAGLEAYNYKNCTVKVNTADNFGYLYQVIVSDPVSGYSNTYPIKGKKLSKVIVAILNTQGSYNVHDYKTNYRVCVEAINCAKEILNLGIELDEKDRLIDGKASTGLIDIEVSNDKKIKSTADYPIFSSLDANGRSLKAKGRGRCRNIYF